MTVTVHRGQIRCPLLSFTRVFQPNQPSSGTIWSKAVKNFHKNDNKIKDFLST